MVALIALFNNKARKRKNRHDSIAKKSILHHSYTITVGRKVSQGNSQKFFYFKAFRMQYTHFNVYLICILKYHLIRKLSQTNFTLPFTLYTILYLRTNCFISPVSLEKLHVKEDVRQKRKTKSKRKKRLYGL